MKLFGKPEAESPSSEGPDAQALMEQGKQLCSIGESIIAAATAMGAQESDEESPEEDASGDPEESGESDMSSGDDTEDSSSYDKPSFSAKDPKRAAIIIAIKRKLGKK